MPTWSSLHKHAEVVDRHPDGKPRHVKATLKIMGITDKEMLEYHWGHDWVVWDAQESFQQRGQHGEYNLTREGDDKTRVRFDIILDLAAPIPEFLIKRAKKIVLNVATESLRKARHGEIRVVSPGVLGNRLSDVAVNRRIASSRVSSRLQKAKRTR